MGDFYSNRRALLSLTINGVKLERVDSFEFLGTMISSTLKWDDNLVCIIKKSHQRLFFLCQLRKLGVFGEGLLQFHRAVIESVHTSLTSVWYGNSAAQQKQQLDRIVCTASKIINCSLTCILDINMTHIQHKGLSILQEPTDPATPLLVTPPFRD